MIKGEMTLTFSHKSMRQLHILPVEKSRFNFEVDNFTYECSVKEIKNIDFDMFTIKFDFVRMWGGYETSSS